MSKWKAFCLVLIAALFLGAVQNVPERTTILKTETISLAADTTATALDPTLIGPGCLLHSIEVKTTLDEIVTVTIITDLGATALAKTTTAAATTGELGTPTAQWPLFPGAKYALSGMTSGTAQLRVTTKWK